jgi:predicted nucleic acid-binding protein
MNDELRDRANEFEKIFGIAPVDAFHLATAEKAEAVFLTTDEKMLKKIRKGHGVLKIQVMNPVEWFMKAVLA